MSRVTLLLAVVVGFLIGLGLGASIAPALAGTARRYSGVEVNNLIETLNGHAASIDVLSSDLSTVMARLNSDPGVGFTNFAPTTSGATADTVRR